MRSKLIVVVLCLISLLQIGWSGKEAALIDAVKKENLQMVQMLLNEGVNPNLRSTGDKTLLMLAAEKGAIKIAELLLKAGANLDAVDHNNKTALLIAREKAQVEMVILLNSWGKLNRQSVQIKPTPSPEPTVNRITNNTQVTATGAVSNQQNDQVIVQPTPQAVTLDKNSMAPEINKEGASKPLETPPPTMENIASEDKPTMVLPTEVTTPTPSLTINEKLISLFFDFNHSNLQANEIAKIQAILPMLKEQSKLFVILGGHADELGNSADNLLKSRQRVTTIKKYLTNEGIAAERIIVYAYGKEHPLKKGHDEDSRAKNRRVDLFISESALSVAEMLSKTVQ